MQVGSIIDWSLETKTNGLTELGSACYGSGENLKIRVSVAISPGHEYLVREKLHLRGLLKSFCETDELYRISKEEGTHSMDVLHDGR